MWTSPESCEIWLSPVISIKRARKIVKVRPKAQKQGRLLRARLCHSVRREVLPPWEAVAKCPVRFIERGESPDDIAVDQRAQDRPPLHALEVPKSEGKKAHRHADKTAHAVIFPWHSDPAERYG